MGDVLPLYTWDDAQETEGWSPGAASRVWLHYALESLQKSFEGRLIIRRGPPQKVLAEILKETNITHVFWNRRYDPTGIATDTKLKSWLQDQGVTVRSFNGSLLWEPWDVLKGDGTPYKVFTPFYKKGCLQGEEPRCPLPLPAKMTFVSHNLHAMKPEELNLLPARPWGKHLASHWEISEEGGHQRLQTFLETGLEGYKEGRDFPSQPHTSRLSPYLHHGLLSPHQIWAASRVSMGSVPAPDLDHFRSELGWREFSYYLLYHFPELPHQNLQSKFDAFPWEDNPAFLKAWKQGQTGIPIVDAGMRELWQTGYMHNRVRMLVASFLIKNLRIDWREGAQWFWDCLVDADLANNSAGWQWVAGSGADAAPYFRIFNPVTQAARFDPEGRYIKQYVPELSKLPPPHCFKPWEAPAEILEKAGVKLGKTYPCPLVPLDASRDEALQAFQTLKIAKT
jgi:deoxyribodipyrimidine photo-lyase